MNEKERERLVNERNSLTDRMDRVTLNENLDKRSSRKHIERQFGDARKRVTDIQRILDSK
jgi:hypothetical protein